MWQPTHMIVTVLRARHVLIKGKNETNNCFVTIALGKEKFQTTVIEKATENVDWHEECELTIPTQGNKAELVFTVLHRNKLGLDDFLGQAVIPLRDMDVYESPRSRWCQLSSKQGKENKKERGELEIRISFTVKSGSLKDLSKTGKSRTSINNLSQLGGSLLSLGTLDKRKSLKGLTKSLGNKLKKNKFKGSSDDISSTASTPSLNEFRKYKGESSFDTISVADPGVISENEDELILDNLSQKSSNPSLASRTHLSEINLSKSHPVPDSPRYADKKTINEQDEWQQKLYGRKQFERKVQNDIQVEPVHHEIVETSSNDKKVDDGDKNVNSNVVLSSDIKVNTIVPEVGIIHEIKPSQQKDNNSFFNKLTKVNSKNKKIPDFREKVDREIQIQSNANKIKLPQSILQRYEGKSREEIILALQNTELEVSSYKQKVKELEDYLDVLLLRVMEREPRILQTPYGNKGYPTKSG